MGKRTKPYKYNCICGFGADDYAKYHSHMVTAKKHDPEGHASAKRVAKTTIEQQPPEALVEEKSLKLEGLKVIQPEAEVVHEAKAKAATKEPKPPKVKNQSNGKWAKIGLGAVIAIIGIGIVVVLYGQNPQNLIWAIGLPMVGFGIFLASRGFQDDSGGSVTAIFQQTPQGPVPTNVAAIQKPSGKENCLNIYPAELGGIRFEHMEEGTFTQSVPQKCENDNRWYYVNRWSKDDNKLVPFVVPDMEYFDPREFANIFDAEPIRRFFEIHFGSLERFAPLVFIGAIALAILAIVILPGVLKGTGNG